MFTLKGKSLFFIAFHELLQYLYSLSTLSNQAPYVVSKR